MGEPFDFLFQSLQKVEMEEVYEPCDGKFYVTRSQGTEIFG